MVFLRIKQVGMEDFSDYLGSVEFKDGVSVNPVTQQEAERLSGIFAMETTEGKDPSSAALYAAIHKGEEPPVVYTEEEVKVVYDFTRASLEAVADTKGIIGLRPIGERYGVKSNSIIGMIDSLMALTGEVKL